MLRLKLTRLGKKHQPSYRIVVSEMRDKRDGQYMAQVGTYDPISKALTIDVAEFDAWVKKGAQPTDTVAALYRKFTQAK